MTSAEDNVLSTLISSNVPIPTLRFVEFVESAERVLANIVPDVLILKVFPIEVFIVISVDPSKAVADDSTAPASVIFLAVCNVKQCPNYQ